MSTWLFPFMHAPVWFRVSRIWVPKLIRKQKSVCFTIIPPVQLSTLYYNARCRLYELSIVSISGVSTQIILFYEGVFFISPQQMNTGMKCIYIKYIADSIVRLNEFYWYFKIITCDVLCTAYRPVSNFAYATGTPQGRCWALLLSFRSKYGGKLVSQPAELFNEQQ